MIAKQKLFLTADKKKLVAEGEKAAFLYAMPGDTIPDEAAQKFGLKDGKLKAKGGTSSTAGKQDSKPAGDGGAGKPKGIKDIAGIGPASIKLLAANGVASVEDLANADPAVIAKLEGLPVQADPTAWVVAAKAMHAAAKVEG